MYICINNTKNINTNMKNKQQRINNNKENKSQTQNHTMKSQMNIYKLNTTNT